jgi:hypothetical protein
MTLGSLAERRADFVSLAREKKRDDACFFEEPMLTTSPGLLSGAIRIIKSSVRFVVRGLIMFHLERMNRDVSTVPSTATSGRRGIDLRRHMTPVAFRIQPVSAQFGCQSLTKTP